MKKENKSEIKGDKNKTIQEINSSWNIELRQLPRFELIISNCDEICVFVWDFCVWD